MKKYCNGRVQIGGKYNDAGHLQPNSGCREKSSNAGSSKMYWAVCNYEYAIIRMTSLLYNILNISGMPQILDLHKIL